MPEGKELERSLRGWAGYRKENPPTVFYRIYLAGKISTNDWRGVRDVGTELYDNLMPWENLDHEVNGCFTVTGPFFVSCDHGCTHVGGTHATYGGCVTFYEKSEARSYVFRECLAAISRCDIFFAWLDEDLTAYGTLVELGYAKALNKTIVIATPSRPHPENGTYWLPSQEIKTYHDDLWFALECADHVIVASDPPKALETLSNPHNLRYMRINRKWTHAQR